MSYLDTLPEIVKTPEFYTYGNKDDCPKMFLLFGDADARNTLIYCMERYFEDDTITYRVGNRFRIPMRISDEDLLNKKMVLINTERRRIGFVKELFAGYAGHEQIISRRLHEMPKQLILSADYRIYAFHPLSQPPENAHHRRRRERKQDRYMEPIVCPSLLRRSHYLSLNPRIGAEEFVDRMTIQPVPEMGMEQMYEEYEEMMDQMIEDYYRPKMLDSESGFDLETVITV